MHRNPQERLGAVLSNLDMAISITSDKCKGCPSESDTSRYHMGRWWGLMDAYQVCFERMNAMHDGHAALKILIAQYARLESIQDKQGRAGARETKGKLNALSEAINLLQTELS